MRLVNRTIFLLLDATRFHQVVNAVSASILRPAVAGRISDPVVNVLQVKRLAYRVLSPREAFGPWERAVLNAPIDLLAGDAAEFRCELDRNQRVRLDHQRSGDLRFEVGFYAVFAVHCHCCCSCVWGGEASAGLLCAGEGDAAFSWHGRRWMNTRHLSITPPKLLRSG